MTNFNFTNESPVSVENPSIEFKATTATAFNPPTTSSSVRAQGQTDVLQNSFVFTGLEKAIRGSITGRRPLYNLKFPRGYYNK